jgi:hypothetical protein
MATRDDARKFSRGKMRVRTPWRLRHQTAKDSLNVAPPPCFYFDACHGVATACRNGKALCEKCAAKTPGQLYPLRQPMPPLMRALDLRLEIEGSVAN